jgi:hypothetical protein
MRPFVFRKRFPEARDAVMRESVVRLRGALMLLMPFHFQGALASRTETLRRISESGLRKIVR